MKTKQTTEIKDINPLKVSDQQLKEFDEGVFELYKNQRAVYDKARSVQAQLGYGGLWRGSGATLLILADLIISKEVEGGEQ